MCALLPLDYSPPFLLWETERNWFCASAKGANEALLHEAAGLGVRLGGGGVRTEGPGSAQTPAAGVGGGKARGDTSGRHAGGKGGPSAPEVSFPALHAPSPPRAGRARPPPQGPAASGCSVTTRGLLPAPWSDGRQGAFLATRFGPLSSLGLPSPGDSARSPTSTGAGARPGVPGPGPEALCTLRTSGCTTPDRLAPLQGALPAAALRGCPRNEGRRARLRGPGGPRAAINAAASPSASSASYLPGHRAQLLAGN